MIPPSQKEGEVKVLDRNINYRLRNENTFVHGHPKTLNIGFLVILQVDKGDTREKVVEVYIFYELINTIFIHFNTNYTIVLYIFNNKGSI